MFTPFGSNPHRPLGPGAVPHRQPQSSPQQPSSTPFQAKYKPDFMTQKPATPKPFERPESKITAHYDRARAELTHHTLHHGPMTEIQARQAAWDKRMDPLGIRRDIQQNQRIYGGQPGQPGQTSQQPQRPSPPTSRTNFQGPRGRFTP